MGDEARTIQSVLLLEDDPHFQAVVREILERIGVATQVVKSVREAKKHFSDGPFEALVVDGLLPDGMGIDFIRWVRLIRPEIPIIYVSSLFRDAVTFQVLKYELGVDKVLPKPISIELLTNEIAEVFGSSEVDDTLGLHREPEREPPVKDADAFAKALQAKTRDFEEALEQRICEVRGSVEAAHQNSNNEIVLLEAIRLMHSLVGTAGSFGHYQISESLRTVERVLRAAAIDPANLAGEHWDLVILAIDQLIRIHHLEHPESADPAR